jgi:hypothetical protein
VATSLTSGGAVVLVELVTARLMGAYFGTGLEMWTSVLGVTMLSLAIGYILGGRWADRQPDGSPAKRLLLFGSVLIIFLPWVAPIVMSVLSPLGLKIGGLFSCLLLLVPSLGVLGALTPVLIRLGTVDPESAGWTSGVVYGGSTLGGVLASLVVSLWLLPEIGAQWGSALAGGLLLLVTFGYIARKSR